VILDREQDEPTRVVLEKGFVILRSGCTSRLLNLLWCFHGRLGVDHLGVLRVNVCLEGGKVGIERLVLLVGLREVELLDRRLHLERLNCSGSLKSDIVSHVEDDAPVANWRRWLLTCFEGVRVEAIAERRCKVMDNEWNRV
jgi:hypothetical protein